ncbi:polycystin-1 [Stegastes partitus]|uniref:Polycystin-1 n=1 Tax=Stegastes partitus TaxID=144197 RepID=A0A9Y4N0L6_9TELE|nr:PREDICTED: polycystin-1-like [Stegastes partitus]
MTARLVSQKQALLCILSVVLIITLGENTPCPEGGQIHLASLQCYWLSEMPLSWFEAQDSCRKTPGRNLASADSQELQHFIFHSFPVKTTVWVWLWGLGRDGPEQDEVVEPQSPGRWDGDGQRVCSQMALGALGRRRKAQCAGRYLFLCEKEVTDSLPSIDSYLTGLVLMTGVYAVNKIQPLPSVPDIGQQTVEMQLFPGLWFSHAGQLVSVELVVQPSPVSSVARVQILRPYCSPNHHLVPPGCSSLLNPFSCCSAVPLCNTTGGCSMGQYWCHLLEACVPTTSPCSPYDSAAVGRGFTLPPRYPALPPFYHLVADLPLRINPSSQLKTLSLLLSEQVIMVYPDDIVAVQHTLDSGTFLHCLNGEASLNSLWRQSYLSISGTEWGGWLEGGLTSLPHGSKWVDGVVCDLRMLYVDTLHRATEHDDVSDYTQAETTTAPDIRPPTAGPNPSLTSKFRLNVIHPLPDEKNQIHVQINVPTLLVVKALFGEKARSSWSAPVLQTGVPFLSSCPEGMVQSSPGCKKQSQEAWFSSVTLLLPSAGVQMLNISVMDAESFQNVSVKVCGYEAVTGLTVEPHGCLRMLIDTSQSFTAKVESGSSVQFTWVIDNLEKFANEGESYSVMFKKPAEYKLRVSPFSQSQQILLIAEEMTPLAEPEFQLVREVVAVDATHVYTIRVKADISLPVSFRWDFGDGTGSVVHTQSAPCLTMDGNVKRGENQVYVQDSVNHAYSVPEDYTLHVHISNQYDNADASMKINVRPQLKSLLISPSTLMPLVKQTLYLETSIEPSDFLVFYTWDYGDGSKAVQSTHHKVSHSFGSAGVYNITVCASNTLTSLTAWLMVVVMEKISGLTVTYSGPNEVGSSTHIKADVVAGTSLKWDFDFGDGFLQENLTDGSIAHIYKFPGNYTVDVTVSNSVSQAHRSINVEVYSLTVSGVFPTECVMSGKNIQFSALVNGNVSSLTFHWLFGEDSSLTVVTGRSTAMHTFPNHGIFHVNLTVFSSVTSVAFSSTICVESPITTVEVQSSQDVVAAGEEVCFRVLVSPEQKTGYKFKWLSNSSELAAVAENSQKCFVFRDEGVEEVSVTVRNKVSTTTAKAEITIQKPVSKFSIAHDGQIDTLTVNTLTTFWVLGCTGSNASVLWDFGDGSPVSQKQNVSHVFTSTGQFIVTATAFNAVSRDSSSLKVNIFLPVSDLSLHTNHPYAAVGEETLITAISSAISSTNYYWTVEGITSTKQGTYQFRFTFPKPGVHRVKVIAQNLVSKMEAAIIIEVLERIEGLQIECQSLTNEKYVSTLEDLLFIATVTKGSNVTYHWLVTQSGTNRQITGDGELFHVLAESPGSISVQLKASNILGDITSTVSVVAVERVTSAHIATLSNIVALGKLVNISVFVDTGSDLQYFWYVNTDLPPLQTHVPFLLHTFTSLGQCLVRVSVQNFVSQSNDTTEFLVQEEVQGLDFQINSKKDPFYVNASAALSFHGFIRNGSDLRWDWKVATAKQNLFTSTSQTFIYRFLHAGIHQVYLNVSNRISWQVVSHSVTVQESIKGLLLNISKSSLCIGEQVTVLPTISKGSNVTFGITFQNKDWIHRQDISEGHFTTSSLPVGRHLVTVKALNQVSSAEASSSIIVSERIQGFRLVNCCSTTLEALKAIQFKADIQSGFPVHYTWIFHLGRSGPTRLMGQKVTFTSPESGSLSVSVLASNGLCSETINDTVTVEWPVKKVNIVCHSEKIFVGHSVRFSAVNEGSNVRYLWDFGDSTEVLVTDLSAVNHTYFITGNYSVTVKVLNSVSHVSTQLYMKVEDLQCSSPQASLLQSESTIFRSRPSFFEASVNINCSAYKTTYLWEIYRDSNGTKGSTNLSGNKVALKSQEDATSPFLLLPKHVLDVGCYSLVFTVSFHGTPLLIQRKTSFTVVHSPLVAVIKGGSHRLWPSFSDLVLDGSECHDPDVEPGGEDTLQYHWAWMTAVTVSEAPVLPLTVECVSCSVRSPAPHISYNTPVVLAGQCEQCDDQAQYKWSAEDHSGLTLDLDELTTSTGRHSPNLVVRSGVLQPGRSYTFALDVSQPGSGQSGSAILTIQPNNPPHGGQCDLSPESDIRLLETVVTYSCSGWQNDESMTSQLIYTFQVASCQPISSVCPVLTLYRGTRSVFSSLVPMGSPGQQKNMSVIAVTLLVEDHLGAKVIALNRTLTVENPERDEVASQWLRNKSQTELWALVQHGNPQEVVPYSIALTSKLNQMEFEWTAVELMDRREIRENVTQALASLPVSSLLDVDQISSALSQSTAVPSELICESCQEKVLEAVGKMIHVIEEQMSPAVLPAVDTGRNILNVIGSTLAAVSSSSHPAYSSTLQAASVIALSALSHAGALMRTLMHSRVHEEAPLSLSTNYINTFGFQGDPSDLLCTHQLNGSNQHHISRSLSSSPNGSESSHPCQFHIPTSLTAHLRSQRSEVVQVLFDVDGALESNPLLTAAEPPISTTLVAMELSTPQGQPIPIQDLDPEQAIRVTLPNKYPVELGDRGGGGREGKAGNGTCLTVTLPTEGRLNFTVKALDDLDENAGLYISFNFSLAPGATPVSLGHVKTEVSCAVPGSNASQDSLVREWALTLSGLASSSEETIFLSPLSLCQYYSVTERRWRSDGLQPLEGSTLHAAQCLTQHLTMFGASLFVHPGAVVLLPPSGGPMRNMVVGIVCAVLVLIHLLVGLIAHKLDHLDSLRLSQLPLCGRPGLYHYRVLVKTGWRPGAGTTAHVGISLYGVNKSGSRHLQRDGAFQRGSLDQFHVETDDNLGEVWKIRVWHDNTGLDPSWYVQHVVVWDPQTDHMFFFLLEDWLSVENQKNGTVEKEVLASCPEELTQFGRVLTSQLMFGMVERHLWLSLWERPAHSSFTRGQRVTCSALVLHLYLALGALWYGAVSTEGHSGPVSAHLLVNMETVAVGMTVAVLVFPLQCFFCFLFRKAHSQVTVDMSVPPSPVCHSVEMDVYLGQSELSGPSFLSLPDSSGPVRDSPSSLLESKALNSSILDFWAASGLAPQTDGAYQEKAVVTWPSCDSLLNLPAGSRPAKTTLAPDLCKSSPVQGPTRQLRRKKALMQLHLASPVSPVSSTALLSSSCTFSEDISNSHVFSAEAGQKSLNVNPKPVRVYSQNLTTLLTLSEEDLLMSIAAAEDTADATNRNSDSGRDSPRTTSSFSTTRSTSCSSWSDQSEDKSLYGAEISKADLQSYPSLCGAGLYKCPSVLSVDSVASTFLPSPSPDSTRSSSTTRIGVARGQPSRLLPPWALCVIYPLVAVLLGACLAVVGLYGSFFSRTVVLMWLTSALSAFLTSALLLEPLKVCVQALICTALWRPVDPEVEEQLAQETTVVRAFGEHSGKVRPPCGYGLLQAKEEARKVRALRSLMRHCVCQLLFLLLVLMVNYQDRMEQRQGRMLHSAVRKRLHTAPLGFPNLTSLRDWSDAEQWISHTLVPHLHQNPSLLLVGLPQLQFARTRGFPAVRLLGNNSVTTHQLLADTWRLADDSKEQFKTLSIDFTHYHRESGLFICVSTQLEWAGTQGVTLFLFIHPLLIPSSITGLDLQVVLTILLLISALVIFFGELWSMATERAQYLRQLHHWLQLLLAFLSLTTAILQLCFLSLASSCVSQVKSEIIPLLCVPAAGNLEVCAEVGGDRQSAAESLEGAVGSDCPSAAAAAALHSPWKHMEGFVSVHQTSVSVLSVLRGRKVLQRLCRVHPVLGPLYGLLLMGGGVWLMARLCGAVLIRAYRAEQAELFHPAIEPQDYEMVEFFIKRLKLWMGLTKAKQFRHRVKFEGMDIPPSRSSQDSHLSTLSSTLPPSRSPSLFSPFSSPRPLSSALSIRSEDSSVSDPGFEVQPYLDNLLPCVNALLSRFDRVNQITEDIHNLEIKLEEVQARRRKARKKNKEESEGIFGELRKPKEPEEGRIVGEVRHRKTGVLYPRPRVSLPSSFSFTPSTFQPSAASVCIFPRKRNSYSESESGSLQSQPSSEASLSETPKLAPGNFGLHAGSPGFARFPRRRAWYSGSSHSADAAQRALQLPGAALCRNSGENLAFANTRPRSEEGVRRQISDGVPVKRKAWLSEGPETE